MCDIIKLDGVAPKNRTFGSDFESLKNSWKSLGNRELNTELGTVHGKTIRLPKRIGKIGVRYIINGEDRIKGILPFISDESIRNIKDLVKGQIQFGTLRSMLESIGEAVNKELDSVARSIRCGDTVNRVLTLGMSDDAVALASKFKLGSVLCLYAMVRRI